jgi:hypothetical protein
MFGHAFEAMDRGNLRSVVITLLDHPKGYFVSAESFDHDHSATTYLGSHTSFRITPLADFWPFGSQFINFRTAYHSERETAAQIRRSTL